jgi:Phage capsid protein
MSDGLIDLFTTQYATNLQLKLQQMGSKLRGRVDEGPHVGKQASPINQIGAVQSQAPAGRFAPMNRVDPTFTRRWVFPNDRELPQLIDSFDELRTIVDPKSQYVQGAAAAFGRDWDDAIIAAAFGSSTLGVDGAAFTTETFSTSSTVANAGYRVVDTFASTASSGLTVAKLIETKRSLRHYHNDLEMEAAVLVIGSQQESDLLNQVQVVSTEFSDKPVLVDGKVTRFLGFDIVLSERLTVSSSLRQCIAYVKSGLYLGVWQDMYNRVSQRNDLSGEPWQVYSRHTYGATRTQPGKVFQVMCYDQGGADITP